MTTQISLHDNYQSSRFISRETVVYRALNKVNGKGYIGITTDFKERQWQHRRGKIKRRSLLKRAGEKHGWENIEFKIIERCPNFATACEAERLWIQEEEPEYNLSEGGEGALGYRHTEEQLKARGQRVSSLKGKRRPIEVIEKMRQSLTGKKQTMTAKNMEAKRRNATLMQALRRQMYEIKNIEKSLFKRKNGEARRKRIICINDGKIFESCRWAADYYGIGNSGITQVLKGKLNSSGGLFFNYVRSPWH